MLIAYTSPLLARLELTSADQTNAEALITAVGSAIDTYCKRHIESAERTQTVEVKNNNIFLKAYPLSYVTRILTDRRSVLSLSSTAEVATWATSSTGLRLTKIVSGSTTTSNFAYSTYPTLGELATAVSLVSTWTASATSAYSSYPSADLVWGQSGSGTAALESWFDSNIVYQADDSTGVISIGLPNSWLVSGGYVNRTNKARVTWTGGYTTVPSDIQYACAELVIASWDKSKSGSITSENLGDYSYSIGSEVLSSVPVTVKSILDSYRQRIA